MSRRRTNGGILAAAGNNLPLLGAVAAGILILVIGAAVLLGGGNGDDGGSGSTDDNARSAGILTASPAAQGSIDLSRPAAEATNLGPDSIGPDDRFVIPSIGVDAPLTYRYVEPDGAGGGSMTNPEGPDDIAYYDFSDIPGKGGAPGLGGNSVYAGHVDSGTVPCVDGTVPPPCTAVLWDLNNLVIGDEIEVHVDGEVYTYAVTANQPVAATEDFSSIVASTATESVTIITCGGDFNRATGQYDFRQVVTADRIT